MPFLAINFGNMFDPDNQKAFSTQAQADSRARDILTSLPGSNVQVVEILKVYTAKVTVTAKDPDPVASEPDAASPAAQ